MLQMMFVSILHVYQIRDIIVAWTDSTVGCGQSLNLQCLVIKAVYLTDGRRVLCK